MEMCGLIPARAGSKGVQGKNIAPCAGRPLLAWTCEAALRSAKLDQVIVSTDSPEIAAVAAVWRVDSPFLRPPELSTDTATSLSVMVHALDWLEERGTSVRAIVLLQPTSPLRTARNIDEAISLFVDSEADTVVSVMNVPHRFNPEALMTETDGRLHPYEGQQLTGARRQEMPTLLARNGPAVLITAPHVLRSGRLYGDSTRAYRMSAGESLDIDDSEDLQYAEYLLARRPSGAGTQ